MGAWGKFILGAIATEALVEILIHSDLFKGPREWLKTRSGFFDALLSCGWCLSVWVAGGVLCVIAAGWTWILYVFIIHRLSNYLHMAFGVLRKIRWGGGGE